MRKGKAGLLAPRTHRSQNLQAHVKRLHSFGRDEIRAGDTNFRRVKCGRGLYSRFNCGYKYREVR